MKNINEIIQRWDSAVLNVLLPLQTFQKVEEKDCRKLEEVALEIVVFYKDKDPISKRVLADFYAIPQMIRNEAHYRKENEQLERMASYVEHCFHLILGNEIPGERSPDKPRII